MQRAKGFVCRYSYPPEGRQEASIEVELGDRQGFAAGAGFRLFARPWVTTPEAEGERQPLVTSTVVLAYAGRIDNRDELARRLGRPSLLRGGDGAFLLQAYEEWGEMFPAKVLGEYSFALIDRRSGRLLAGRDSLGIGRLFRYDSSGAVWVASSLELLLQGLPERPPFDRAALAEYFAGGGLMTSGRTVYRGVRELPAAHISSQAGSGAVIARYWEPDAGRLQLNGAREYDEAFRLLLFEAVRASMRSTNRVWCDLSGGLDSSTVTAVAVRLTGSNGVPADGLGAFSMFTSEALNDERSYQQALLKSYPIEHVALDADMHLSFSSLDEPRSAHPSKAILYRPLWHAAARLFDSHGVVAHLTGRGGDPLFCGDEFPPVHLAELVRGLDLRKWYREIRNWARQGKRSIGNLLWHCSSGRMVDTYAGSLKGEPPTWLEKSFREEVGTAEAEPWRPQGRIYSSPARELQYRRIMQTAAIARFIRVGDERHPLFYRPLVEFVLALPWEHLLSPAMDRVIQRRALVGILPEAIRVRTSKSSGTPLLLRGLRENWSEARPLTEGYHLANLDLVERIPFQEACKRFRHGLMGRRLRYFAAALSLEIWLSANGTRAADKELAAWLAASKTGRLPGATAVSHA